MKRFVIAMLMLAAGSTVAVAAASSPRAHLRQFVCNAALRPSARAVSVRTVMRPLPGTESMSLRFELLAEPGLADSFGEVRGGDLGTWIHPPNRSLGQRPGDVWILDRRVLDVSAPSTYRFRVTFRWTGARGRVLGSVQRLSPLCQQSELRPDLLVESIIVKPADKPGNDAYTAVIRNAGATGAGPFYVSFQDAGGQKERQIQGLGPNSRVRVTIAGPACTTGAVVSVIIDPDHQVEDYNRANNSLSVTCPAPAGAGVEPRYTS